MPQTVTPILERPFDNVKPPFNVQLPILPEAVIHHKVHWYTDIVVYSSRGVRLPSPYGVSRPQRALSPQVLLKRFDQVRDCLQYAVGLTTGQREVTLKLLRLWTYYGQVYPKASTFSDEPGSSRSMFWRTIKVLSEHGLVNVVNRFLIREHAQISNLYRFDKLLILIARYLAEHGQEFREKWLQPYLSIAGCLFWGKTVWLQEPELAMPFHEQTRDRSLLKSQVAFGA